MLSLPLFRAGILFGVGLSVIAAVKVPLPADTQAALNSITAGELKGDLSFLASDLLQGRYTPSPGLEIAAEFIASKFRAAGLEPGMGPDPAQDYFQIAPMVERRMAPAATELTVQGPSGRITIPADAIGISDASQESKIEGAPVLFLSAKDPAKLKGLSLQGRAVVAPQPDFSKLPDSEKGTAYRKVRQFEMALASSGAAIEVTIVSRKPGVRGGRLILPEQQQQRSPSVTVISDELGKLMEHGGEGRLYRLPCPRP